MLLAERLPDMCRVRLHAGDVLRVLAPGRGAWGTSPQLGHLARQSNGILQACEQPLTGQGAS